MKSWQDRAAEMTGERDGIYTQLKKEGYDVTRKEVRSYLKKAAPVSNRETITINSDGTTSEKIIRGSATQMRDADFLLKEHGFDGAWEIVSARSSIWDAHTAEGPEQFYSSRITVKPSGRVNVDKLLGRFIAKAQAYSPVKPRKTSPGNDNIFIINISDLHLGQLSWGKESGDNYDCKIAAEKFRNLISDACGKSPYKAYDRVVFIMGNDFFNSDTVENTTTKGTHQSNDVRWQKMFDMGCDLLVEGVEMLRAWFPNTPVETLLVPGNHEETTIYHACKYLWAWYRNDRSVTIDTSPRLHKGLSYGSTALLFTHGERELKNLDWVYTEFRDLIGETKTTEIHAGHQHRIKVEEKNGALIRVNPTPAALNAWSYSQGYGSTAQTISRIYNKEEGLVYEIYSRA